MRQAKNRKKVDYFQRTTALLIAPLFLFWYIHPSPGFAFEVQVTEGDADVLKEGDTTIVNLRGRAIFEGNTSILPNEVVRFVGESDALLRDITGSRTEWLGSLLAEGKIILVNTSGVFIAEAAKINVASLIASTLNIQNELFLTNQLMFEKIKGANAAEILNEANIKSRDGGYLILLGDQVKNQGKLTAYLGSVALGSGEKMTVSFDPDGLVNLVVDEGLQQELKNSDGSSADQVLNKGEIMADGGRVTMTAKLLEKTLSRIVNNEGVIRASHAVERDGEVELVADGAISTKASLTTDYLYERGATLKIGGIFNVGRSSIQNLDRAMVFEEDTTISGTISDLENIEIEDYVTLSLSGDTVLWADRDANSSGYVYMGAGAAIDGNQHDLTVRAGEASDFANITDVKKLTIDDSGIAEPDVEFVFNGDLNVETVYTKFGARFTKNSGDGSEESPYQIYDITQLASLVSGFDTHYILMNHIDASATEDWNSGQGFIPIGYEVFDFIGDFDGNEKIISNLTILGAGWDYIGLFGVISGGSVHDLGIENINMTGDSYVGGLAGRITNHSTIDNVYMTGAILGDTGVGGIAGLLEDESIIRNSYSGANVSGAINVGGLAGQVESSSTVEDSYATGDILAFYNAGGAVGYVENSEILNSYALGDVSVLGSNAGGLVGYAEGEDALIRQSYAEGNVSGDDLVGGFVGGLYNDAVIAESYATGNVEASGDSSGGFAGLIESYSSIYDSYATGNVSGGENYIGGFVGSVLDHSAVRTSYATGTVESDGNAVGGFAGRIENFSEVSDSFTVSEIMSESGTNVGGFVGNNDGGLANDWYSNYYDPVGSGDTDGVSFTMSPADFMSHSHLVYDEWSLGDDVEDGAVWAMANRQSAYPLLSFRMANWNEDDEYYEVADAYQLQLMFMNLDSSFRLVTDIDASQTAYWNADGNGGYFGFAPIGQGGDSFQGDFDGQNYVISDLYIQRPDESFVGLFGDVFAASIQDVTLSDVNITGNSSTGALVGYAAYQSVIDNVFIIEESSVTGADEYTGGLVGLLEDSSTIKNSGSSASIQGEESVGGLVGGVDSYSEIINSYATGDVIGDDYSIGGLVGYLDDYSRVRNSYATGTVRGGYYEEESFVPSSENVGGLVGLSSYYSKVENSYATGNVYGSDDVGGLVGENENGSRVSNSFASGQVTAEFAGGGLVGWNDYYGQINNSYATGSVTGITEFSRAGGLVGVNEDEAFIQNSYASGLVTSAGTSGGLVAVTRDGASVVDSFWDSITTGQSYSSGSADYYGRPTALMKFKGTFLDEGWDFNGLWKMDANERPHLIWEDMDGGGTGLSPWEITNVNELQFARYALDDYFVLANDIDASATEKWNYDRNSNIFLGFNPIGDDDVAFTGDFYGGDYEITGLYINRPNEDYVGLFGEIYEGNADDVRLLDVFVVGNDYVGALAGSIGSSNVEDSFSTGHVGGRNRIGGLVGLISNSSYVENSFSRASVAGEDEVGGFAGLVQGSSELDRNFATGTVSGSEGVGGFVGFSEDSTIDNSFAWGDVTGAVYVGGFAGVNHSSSISRSYAAGSVTGDEAVGGFVGRHTNDDQISHSFAVGSVTTDGANTGGFAGLVEDDAAFDNVWYSNNHEMSVGSGNSTGVNFDSDFEYGFYEDHSVYNGATSWDFSDVWAASGRFETLPLLRFRYSTHIEDDIQLQMMFVDSAATYYLDKDIDVSETAYWNPTQGGERAGFDPVLLESEASFFGQGHTITGLTINRQDRDYVGLFSELDGASVYDLGLVDMEITGRAQVGGIAGYMNNSSKIKNSFTRGSVSSVVESGETSRVGGLAGYLATFSRIEHSYSLASVSGENYVGGLAGGLENVSLIKFSYADSAVNGAEHVGGLAGYANNNSSISSAYALGDVSGWSRVGGFVGTLTDNSVIANSYARGDVNAGSDIAGGLVGEASLNSSVERSYAVGEVTSVGGNVGGLVGLDADTTLSLTDSYWDRETTGQLHSAGSDDSYGVTTALLKDSGFLADANWDLNGLWKVDTSNQGYAHLLWQDMVYDDDFLGNGGQMAMKISNVNELQFVNYITGGNFAVVNNIDASATEFWNPDLDSEAYFGFNPIGNENDFTGTFDGGSFTISGLYINQEHNGSIGLFSRTASADLSNVILENVDIRGGDNVGGLVGLADDGTQIAHSSVSGTVRGEENVGGLAGTVRDRSSVSTSHSSATVEGSQDDVGGLVGYLYDHSRINDSYATGSVTGGATYTGGFVGYQKQYSDIDNSYATGDVTGVDSVGGFVGSNYRFTVIQNSYASGNVSGEEKVGGFVGWIGGSDSYYDIVRNSYSTGNVTASNDEAGGFAGRVDHGTVTNAFSLGNVISESSQAGGFVGLSEDESIIENAYATGTVEGANNVGGFAGEVESSMIVNSFSINNSVQATDSESPMAGGFAGYDDGGNTYINNWWFNSVEQALGSSLDEVDINREDEAGAFFDPDHSVYNLSLDGTSWSISSQLEDDVIWGISDKNTALPLLQFRYATTIQDIIQLQLMYLNRDATYTLANNIDASLTERMNPHGEGYFGFDSIGDEISNAFTGIFDGARHRISDLTINRSNEGYIGLFGYTNQALIKNVSLRDVAVVGNNHTGGLVGYDVQGSYIENAYVTGVVEGADYTGGLVGDADNDILLLNTYADVTVSGSLRVGGLIGAINGTIRSSYASGNVSGVDSVGGLVGYSAGDISLSHATGDVTGTGVEIGGLVGYAFLGDISYSYATGDVSGYERVGGFVGKNGSAHISNAYAMGNVAGSGLGNSKIGGFAGYSSGNIEKTYSAGFVSGVSLVGGFVGINDEGSFVSNFFLQDDEVNEGLLGEGSSSLMGVTGLTTEEMQTPSVFSSEGWDFYGLWRQGSDDFMLFVWQDMMNISEGSFGDFTGGTENHPWEISDINELQFMAYALNDYFVLTDNISASETEDWNAGAGFHSIASADGSVFRGTLDGDGYAIEDLYIYSSGENHTGLFGNLGGTVRDIEFINADVTGTEYIGILAGFVTGESVIDGVSATGSVSGTGDETSYLGGLIGELSEGSRLLNSRADVHVVGSYYTGGLVGRLSDGSRISNSYALGHVEGGYYTGGLVGGMLEDNTIQNSYASGLVEGTYYLGGLVGCLFDGGNKIHDSYATGDVRGDNYVGGLAGYGGFHSVIDNTYASGEVEASEDYAGGLVGRIGGDSEWPANSTVMRSFATGNVSGQAEVGGLVGYMEESFIYESYTNGQLIRGDINVGGLVGRGDSGSLIENTFSMSEVAGGENPNYAFGGLVGNLEASFILKSYATGYVSGVNDVGGLVGLMGNSGQSVIKDSFVVNGYVDHSGDNAGGLVGYDSGHEGNAYSNNYWDNNLANGVGGEGIANEETGQWEIAGNGTDFFDSEHPVYESWNILPVLGASAWAHSGESRAFPLLQFRYSTTITDVVQLQLMYLDLDADYTLARDIETGETEYWNFGYGFEPIGDYGDSLAYTGTFDGNGHVINSLMIDQSSESDGVGLFSYVQGGVIKRVGLNNAMIAGGTNVGGLAGVADTTQFSEVYVTGEVEGSRQVGGLVGFLGGYSSVTNAYSNADVSASDEIVGGIAGEVSQSSLIHTYVAGHVSGTEENIGAVVGYNYEGEYTENFFNNTINFGLTDTGNDGNVDGIAGGLEAQMKLKTIYADAGWDVEETPIWDTYTGLFPHLSWENYSPEGLHDLSGVAYHHMGVGAGYDVRLYYNGSLAEETQTNEGGEYSFSNIYFPEDVFLYFVLEGGGGLGATAVYQYETPEGDIQADIYGEALSLGGFGTAINHSHLAQLYESIPEEDIFFSVDEGNALTLDDGYDLRVMPGGGYELDGELTARSIWISEGASLAAEGYNINLFGSWYNEGEFYAGGNLVTFTALSGLETISKGDSGTGNFYSIRFVDEDGGSDVIYELHDDLDVDGNLTLSSGALDVSEDHYTIRVGGSWSVESGTYNHRSAGLVVLTSGESSVDAGDQSFYRLTITGSYDLVNHPLTVIDNLDLDSGILNAQGYSISEGGNWGAHEFNNISNLGDVTLTGANKEITSSEHSFGNLTITGSYTLQDELAAVGNLNVATGTLDADGFGIAEGGDWGTDEFNQISNLGNVTLTGTDKQIVSDGHSFGNLTITGSYTLQDDLIASGDLSVGAGTLDAAAFGISEAGDWGVDEFDHISNLGDVTLSGANKDITSNGYSFANLTITGSYTLRYDLLVSGNLNVAAGTLDAGSFEIAEGGDWGTDEFNQISNLGNVTLTGTDKQITSDGHSFGNLTITGSYTLQDDLIASGDLSVGAGTLDADGYAISEGGGWDADQSANTSNLGNVTLAGTDKGITLNGHSFGNLTITGSYTLQDDFIASGDLNVAAGTLDASGHAISEGGDWGADEFTNISNRGNVTLSGTDKQLASIGNSFYTLTITGSYTLQDDLIAIVDLSVATGTLNADHYAISEAGDWDAYQSANISNLGNVLLSGTDKEITSDGYSFGNLTLLGSYTLADDLSVIGNLSIASGTLNAAHHAILEEGDWGVDEFTRISNLGDVTLGGTDNQITSDGHSFGNLSILGSYIVQDDLIVIGNLNVASGVLDADNHGISEGGDWGSDEFAHILNRSTITLSGIDKQILSYGSSFVDLTVTGSYTLQDDLIATGDLNVGVGTLDANGYAISEGGDWGVDEFTRISNLGNVTLSGTGKTIEASGYSFSGNLTVTGFYQLADALSVGGDFSIVAGGVDANGQSMTIGGDWLNTGIFAHGGNTVMLEGEGQRITGNTTFFNLTKEVTAEDTLEFEADATQQVEGTLTLKGSTDGNLSLRSTLEGTQWSLSVQNIDLEYLDVQDSNNLGAVINVLSDVNVDSGNNFGWIFGEDMGLTPVDPITHLENNRIELFDILKELKRSEMMNKNQSTSLISEEDLYGSNQISAAPSSETGLNGIIQASQVVDNYGTIELVPAVSRT